MEVSFTVIQHKLITDVAKMLLVVPVFKKSATSCPFKLLLSNRVDNYCITTEVDNLKILFP